MRTSPCSAYSKGTDRQRTTVRIAVFPSKSPEYRPACTRNPRGVARTVGDRNAGARGWRVAAGRGRRRATRAGKVSGKGRSASAMPRDPRPPSRGIPVGSRRHAWTARESRGPGRERPCRSVAGEGHKIGRRRLVTAPAAGQANSAPTFVSAQGRGRRGGPQTCHFTRLESLKRPGQVPPAGLFAAGGPRSLRGRLAIARFML